MEDSHTELEIIKDTFPRAIGAICTKLKAQCNPEAVHAALMGPAPGYRLLVESADELKSAIQALSTSPITDLPDTTVSGKEDTDKDDNVFPAPESHYGLSTVMAADGGGGSVDDECELWEQGPDPKRRCGNTKRVSFSTVLDTRDPVLPSTGTCDASIPMSMYTPGATTPGATGGPIGMDDDASPPASAPSVEPAAGQATVMCSLLRIMDRLPESVNPVDVLDLVAAITSEQTKQVVASEQTKRLVTAAEEKTKRLTNASEEKTKRLTNATEEKTKRVNIRETHRTKRKQLSSSGKWYLAVQQSFKCNLCAEMLQHTAEVDHIVPLKCNGGNEISNMQVVCTACHADKTKREQYKFLCIITDG
jgi:5-methylcytosine-specific restriction endonuclease McrA